MHFERIYIQDNFVPNYDVDPFRRKVVGISVCFKKGESVNDAIAQGENFISEYIKANTILPTGEMKGTHVTTVNPEQEEQLQQEFLKLEEKLKSFEYREDAQDYLDTTSWKYAVQAKQIVNSLPTKNK